MKSTTLAVPFTQGKILNPPNEKIRNTRSHREMEERGRVFGGLYGGEVIKLKYDYETENYHKMYALAEVGSRVLSVYLPKHVYKDHGVTATMIVANTNYISKSSHQALMDLRDLEQRDKERKHEGVRQHKFFYCAKDECEKNGTWHVHYVPESIHRSPAPQHFRGAVQAEITQAEYDQIILARKTGNRSFSGGVLCYDTPAPPAKKKRVVSKRKLFRKKK